MAPDPRPSVLQMQPPASQSWGAAQTAMAREAKADAKPALRQGPAGQRHRAWLPGTLLGALPDPAGSMNSMARAASGSRPCAPTWWWRGRRVPSQANRKGLLRWKRGAETWHRSSSVPGLVPPAHASQLRRAGTLTCSCSGLARVSPVPHCQHCSADLGRAPLPRPCSGLSTQGSCEPSPHAQGSTGTQTTSSP